MGKQVVLINCAALWIENENGILLEKRGDDGNWGLIGGVMEIGESPRDTVKRELLEETGLTGEVSDLIGVYSSHRHEYPNGDMAQPVVFFFTCSVDPGDEIVISSESQSIEYFPRTALPSLGMPQHRLLAEVALAGVRNFIE